MLTEFRADIHCHTNCSDGTDTPLELLNKAVEIGLSGLSITDHDTIAAYSEEFLAEAKKLNLAILPGVEFSSEIDNMSVHILGYGFDLYDNGLKNFILKIQAKRKDRNRAILEKLAARKLQIGEEELSDFAKMKTIGRPHIAQLMVNKGYVSTIREAFDRYLKEGALCFASGIKFHPQEVIHEIRKAKGKAVLAHPHFIKRGSFLRKLFDLPFDGLECYYARLDKALEKPWLKIAKDRGLIATGGSDYHGAIKPHIALGSSWVSESVFKSLYPQ